MAALLVKQAGEPFGFTITFTHRGPGGSFDIGVGIAEQGVFSAPVQRWLRATVQVSPSAVDITQVFAINPLLTGEVLWPSGLANASYQMLKFIRKSGLAYPATLTGPSAEQGFLLDDWDKNIVDQGVNIAQDVFGNLSAVYR